jgi:hypothetical protein
MYNIYNLVLNSLELREYILGKYYADPLAQAITVVMLLCSFIKVYPKEES